LTTQNLKVKAQSQRLELKAKTRDVSLRAIDPDEACESGERRGNLNVYLKLVRGIASSLLSSQ